MTLAATAAANLTTNFTATLTAAICAAIGAGWCCHHGIVAPRRIEHGKPKCSRINLTPVVTRVRTISTPRRRRAAIRRDLPDTIELLVLTVRAGLTPIEAVRELSGSAPQGTREGFQRVVHLTERGTPFCDALRALIEILGPEATATVELIGSADRFGVPLGATLDELAREARASRRRLDEAAARRLAVRLTFPLVMCTLPSFVLLAIAPAVIAAISSLATS